MRGAFRVPYVHTSEELAQIVLAMYRKVEARSPSVEPGIVRLKRLEITRVVRTGKALERMLGDTARNMPFLGEMHPFHRDLLALVVEEGNYRHSLAKVGKAYKAIRAIARDAITAIKVAEDRRGVARARRMFLGRIRDLLDDLSSDLDLLRKVARFLRSLPTIDPELPTIIVAGAPNVGKSSFVRCVSSAEPEVAEYPFTTRRIHVGHIDYMGVKVQIVDTPGLLDRPLGELNEVERQAVIALRHIRHAAMFLIDPTHHSGYTLEEQLRVLNTVRYVFEGDLEVVVNKADIADHEQLAEVYAVFGRELPKVSSLHCVGTREVVDGLVRRLAGFG